MKMEPYRILFVGDSANDIHTARAAGMIPQGVAWGYGRLNRLPAKERGILLDHPSQLISILQ
jgi:phosphoglycolate phosphatase